MKILPMVWAGLLALSAGVASAAEIKVSASASLQDAAVELAKTYKASGASDEVTFTFGSSGQLVTQIREGADVDAFISAANKQVDDLEKAGLTQQGTRRIIVRNSLVLIVPVGVQGAPASFADLADTKHKKIAIGEPKTVPAGEYASQAFAALKLTEKVADRLVYATNVRQVLTYVEGGEVAAGVVYLTDAKQSGNKVKVVATADEKTHDPIVYPAVVIKASKKKEAAARFLDFLKSDPARKVLAEKGFDVNVPPFAAGVPAR